MTTKKLIIAIDCDDVLVHTTPFFLNAYNQKYGTYVTLADTQDEHLPSWQAPPTVVNERWVALMDNDDYRALCPGPDEVRILRQLAQRHELHLITARREEERAFTQAMLDRELAGVFTSMEFVGWGGSKGQICARIKADVLIDDNISHLRDAVACGMPPASVILFGDYPWNAGDDAFVRCLDWPSVIERIEALAQGA